MAIKDPVEIYHPQLKQFSVVPRSAVPKWAESGWATDLPKQQAGTAPDNKPDVAPPTAAKKK